MIVWSKIIPLPGFAAAASGGLQRLDWFRCRSRSRCSNLQADFAPGPPATSTGCETQSQSHLDRAVRINMTCLPAAGCRLLLRPVACGVPMLHSGAPRTHSACSCQWSTQLQLAAHKDLCRCRSHRLLPAQSQARGKAQQASKQEILLTQSHPLMVKQRQNEQQLQPTIDKQSA